MEEKSCLNCIHENVCRLWENLDGMISELFLQMQLPEGGTEENKKETADMHARIRGRVAKEQAPNCEHYEPEE